MEYVTDGIFIGVMAMLGCILIYYQTKPDDFDLRDAICSFNLKTGKRVVATDKTLLAGAFLASSYYVIKHPTDVGYASYLAAWVTNGGIAAWHRNHIKAQK